MSKKAPIQPPPSHPPLGTLIDNNTLELVEVLGVGGYGVVYRAVDAFSNGRRSFAVKCLASNHGHSSLRRQLHIREITLHQIASAHPSVVSLHRVVEDMNHMFIIMEFAPDDDLFTQILHKCQYLGNNGLIKHVFLQLIDAVQYCHSLGIYHRDLKPENILCFDGGFRVAITDFGLATTDKMSKEFRTGSVYHMSPGTLFLYDHFIDGTTLKPMHNDIWSLGIILLNLVTGRNPWKAAMVDDPTYHAYTQDPLRFLTGVLPISEELNDILVQALDIDWRGRLSLSEFRAQIRDITNFYSDNVIFEGSLARCPWEAGVDLGNVDNRKPVEKRPVPKVPEGVEPYCVLSVSGVASTFKSQESTAGDYFEREVWVGDGDSCYGDRPNDMDLFEDELEMPYENSGRSSYSSDLSEPTTPNSAGHPHYNDFRDTFGMESAYDYQSSDIYGAESTAYPSFAGSTATEMTDDNRFASSVFLATPVVESKPFFHHHQDETYMDDYRTQKRYSSPNTSVYAVAAEQSLYSKYSDDSHSVSSLEDFPPRSPNYVVWPEQQRHIGSRPIAIQESHARRSKVKSQNLFNPMRFFPRSSGSSWLTPKASPLANRPVATSAGGHMHNAGPSTGQGMHWADYHHHHRSGHHGQKRIAGNTHRYPHGGYGTQPRSSRDWIP